MNQASIRHQALQVALMLPENTSDAFSVLKQAQILIEWRDAKVSTGAVFPEEEPAL